METITELIKLELFHKHFNLGKKDNLDEVPRQKAIFGIFSVVMEQPANCRYIAATKDLRETIRLLFEDPQEEGMRKFMQGPWMKILQYAFLPDPSEEESQIALEHWSRTYKPGIDEEGEYPGYY